MVAGRHEQTEPPDLQDQELAGVYPDRLVVAAEGNILCEHARLIQRSHHLPPRTIYDWRHYLAVVQRKPGALRNGAPFIE